MINLHWLPVTCIVKGEVPLVNGLTIDVGTGSLVCQLPFHRVM